MHLQECCSHFSTLAWTEYTSPWVIVCALGYGNVDFSLNSDVLLGPLHSLTLTKG